MLKTERKNSARAYDYCASCTFYLGAIIVTLVCQALAGFVSAALAGKIADISTDGDFNTAFMIFVQLVNGAFIAYFTLRNNYKFEFTVFGKPFSSRRNGKAFTAAMFVIPVLCAALLMITMYLPTIWYGFFTQYALKLDPSMGNINLTTASATVMIVIASVFLAPVCEEFIYRGVLLNGLANKKSPVKAVLLSSLAFMLMHMSPIQVVFQFSLGVVGAYIVLKSGRLFPSMLMHATANALALVMELTPLGAALGGCVEWLTNNITAAVFITLGLFVGGGAALYAVIRFGFGLARKISDPDCAEKTPSAEDDSDDTATNGATPDAIRARMTSAARDRDGTMRYYIGVGICALMLIVNLVVGML